MKAKLLRQLDGFSGDARLYEVDPPMTWTEYVDDGERENKANHVVVSAANVMFSGPETYIFPANEAGEVVNWGEMDGSFKGGLDHARALANAGYEIDGE